MKDRSAVTELIRTVLEIQALPVVGNSPLMIAIEENGGNQPPTSVGPPFGHRSRITEVHTLYHFIGRRRLEYARRRCIYREEVEPVRGAGEPLEENYGVNDSERL